MCSLYKGSTSSLGKLLRIGSIESIEHPDYVGAFARESCILQVNKIRIGESPARLVFCENMRHREGWCLGAAHMSQRLCV